MDLHCHGHELQTSQVRFFVDGMRITPDDTAEKLALVDEGRIDVAMAPLQGDFVDVAPVAPMPVTAPDTDTYTTVRMLLDAPVGVTIRVRLIVALDMPVSDMRVVSAPFVDFGASDATGRFAVRYFGGPGGRGGPEFGNSAFLDLRQGDRVHVYGSFLRQRSGAGVDYVRASRFVRLEGVELGCFTGLTGS
jgi:hypothetical protein